MPVIESEDYETPGRADECEYAVMAQPDKLFSLVVEWDGWVRGMVFDHVRIQSAVRVPAVGDVGFALPTGI
jgi:hypothetical protein